jgi:hypothetical protein
MPSILAGDLEEVPAIRFSKGVLRLAQGRVSGSFGCAGALDPSADAATPI